MTPKQHVAAAESCLSAAQAVPEAWPERQAHLLEALVHLGLSTAKQPTSTRRTSAKKESS